jgi:chromosome partitioning protein
MHVVAFVTQKGGSGKTTLALYCAVAAEETGRRVLLIDLDLQGTAESWYQEREAETPKLVKIDAPELDEALVTARKNAFDLVFIDTPGRDEPSTAAAIRAADFCIIPCRPTPADMRQCPPRSPLSGDYKNQSHLFSPRHRRAVTASGKRRMD